MYNKILMHLSLVLKQNVLSVFAILALLAAACGGGGGGSSGSSGGGSSTGSTTGTQPVLVSPVTLRATQLQIIDDATTDGSRKFPSRFLMFDISTDTVFTEDVRIDFVLVKVGDTAPATLSDMRTLRTFTNWDKSTSQVSMAYTTILKPNGTTSLYLAFDSMGAYPLLENTRYKLYASQVNTTDTAVKDLGDFTTGTVAAVNNPPRSVHEAARVSDFGGKIYKKPFQFMVINSLVAIDTGNYLDFNDERIFSQAGIIKDFTCTNSNYDITTMPIVSNYLFHCEFSGNQRLVYRHGFDTRTELFTFNDISAD